jgi:predicted PurR-regulated permease PerM
MKKLILFFTLMFASTGCGNLSPKLQAPIDNQNGQIGQIDQLQNSLKAEIMNLKAKNDIMNSQLDRIQQGLVNLQSNSVMNGVQILSGSGGLVVGLFAVLILSGFVYFYKRESDKNAKAANLLAEKVVEQQNPDLEDEVFKAAMYTDVEATVLAAIKKSQAKVRT